MGERVISQGRGFTYGLGAKERDGDGDMHSGKHVRQKSAPPFAFPWASVIKLNVEKICL